MISKLALQFYLHLSLSCVVIESLEGGSSQAVTKSGRPICSQLSPIMKCITSYTHTPK